MITCKLEGGLGNQMFQTAFIYAYAKKHGFDYCVPTVVNNPHKDATSKYMFPGISYYNMEAELPIYKEKEFAYQEIPGIDNVCFQGYFQSFRYFDCYRSEILKAFGFKWESKKGWCAIHIRRGDYLTNAQYHPFVGDEYLKTSIMDMIAHGGVNKFEIYSNDMEWCNSFFSRQIFSGEPIFRYIEGNDELEDLAQGSCCECQILANSTYSLWMYYLNQNPNKICIAPKTWFGPALNHDTKDLYPKNAIIL